MFSVPKDYADASHYAAVLAVLDAQQSCTNAEHAVTFDNKIWFRDFALKFAVRAERYLQGSYVNKSPCHDVRPELSRERLNRALLTLRDRIQNC